MPEENNQEIKRPANAEPEEPRIGVYVCYCGGNISQVVECERVAKAVEGLTNVVASRYARTPANP
jgi:hypothetical protein